MPITHTNRKGDVYYLHEGRTPKGKPRFFFSRKDEGRLVESLPEGYEIYEKPDSAQVYLRQPQESSITAAEREWAQAECRKRAGTNAVLVDIEGDSLVVYFAEGNDRLLATIFGEFGVSSDEMAGMLDWRVTNGRYEKMLRFTLTNEKRRLFSVERWCFLGGIDGWFPLKSSLPLERAVDYAKHLGSESFFDLM